MTDKTVKNHSFQAEVSKLLDLVANSLYSEREIFLRELVSVTVSADKLVKTVVTDYVDSEAKYAFANDSTMQEYMNERDLHYITHGVTMKRTAETV